MSQYIYENTTENISQSGKWRTREKALLALAVILVLVFHGAVPLFMTPTLGQAVWTTGFAQSFANGPWDSMYAHDFGLPLPAAIPFGLAGALSASWLIRLGLNPPDAYAGMAALWLMLAFGSAYLLSLSFGATRSVSVLSAVAWMSMPTIWAHADYAMVSLGISLLSFYFLATLNLLQSRSVPFSVSRALFYLLAVFVSVFMDGYSFVMFATGSSLLFFFFLINGIGRRRDLLKFALPIHIVSFSLAYIVYTTYVGKYTFEQSPIDFFRGWGLDLYFVAIPTKGFHWFLDILGISVRRTDELYFGDASVWRTTFALPIILIGLFAWWRVGLRRNFATGFMIVAMVGFFMALGPSLKIDSTKPMEVQLTLPRQESNMMPAEFALGPTGSAWISETLPGFKSMRASYRWSALGVFALWAAVSIWSGLFRKSYAVPAATFLLITFLNIPNIPQRFRSLIDNRAQFLQMNDDLSVRLHQNIRQNEKVAFVPWGNDFLANYLAPTVGFRTLNIGGDKNLADAQSDWPLAMLSVGSDLDSSDISPIIEMLWNRKTDVVVIPYFHMLWSSQLWPCVDQTRAKLTKFSKEDWNSIPGFYCPDQRRVALRPIIQQIEQLPYLEVTDGDLFATVRLRPQYAAGTSRRSLLGEIFGRMKFPIEFGAALQDSSFILKDGWYALEEHHVWSQSTSKLVLPVPSNCRLNQCLAVLHFNVFGAGDQRPVAIEFESKELSGTWDERITSTTQDNNKISVPLDGTRTHQKITIKVTDATSPRALTGSPDDRTLGVGRWALGVGRWNSSCGSVGCKVRHRRANTLPGNVVHDQNS